MLDPRAAALTAERGLRGIISDPIKAFRFSSKAQRRFCEAFHKYAEVALQAGNQAGKTRIAATFFVALMRGVKILDGASLPLLGTPISGVCLAQGRQMAKESCIAALLQAIGDWPHHVEKDGNAISAIWVKPDASRSEEWRDWSVIRVFVEDGQSVAGMRLDFVWADEPPKWPYWIELRMRGRANRPFLRAITFTPIKKQEWQPIKEDFKGCEKGKNGKLTIRMSVYDNKALSAEHIRMVEQAAAGNHRDAKLLGEFVDITGSNPFDRDGLRRWMSRCRPGDKRLHVSSKGHIGYEVWAGYDPMESYMVVCDPSAGIEDEAKEHDPAGLIVVARRKPRVVARFNGYLPAYDLGRLAKSLCLEYGKALCVWERNSGYGESFYLGLDGYGNVYIEHHLDSRSVPLFERLGWTTSATTRGTLIGALQKAILEDGLFVESAEAVESIGDVVVDRLGRIEAGAGAHDEDMIVFGIACHLLETYKVAPPRPNALGNQFRKDMGIKPRSYVADDPFMMA